MDVDLLCIQSVSHLFFIYLFSYLFIYLFIFSQHLAIKCPYEARASTISDIVQVWTGIISLTALLIFNKFI